ncbi:ParB N-terminal domain-containing protein [Streptomyces sp. NPDC059083]|uniref:ParB N-terminal domain-containing protein n=1 Tax=unclassified Streptomyces TaxID=2593676 RepID=UPI003696D4EA
MNYKTVPIGDLKSDERFRGAEHALRKLTNSIRNNGQRSHILVNPADMSVISGHRRHAALRALRKLNANVVFAQDIVHACRNLEAHFADNGPYAIAMTVQDRITLARRLCLLPRPPGAGRFRLDDHVGQSVGVSAAILQRVRAAARLAAEGDTAPDSVALNARQVLALILQAADSPTEGWTSGQSVRHLQGYLKSGNCPATLREACPARLAEEPSSREKHPVNPAATVALPRARNEVRRGVDTISGACTGLASLAVTHVSAEEAEYLKREIRNSQRILRNVMKSLQESTYAHA